MLNQDYLSLRLARLRRGEKWIHDGTGLSLVFPKGGTGKFVSGSSDHRLKPGDVLVLNGATTGTLSAADRDEMAFWWFSVDCQSLCPLFASEEICLVQGVIESLKRGKLFPAGNPTARTIYRLLADVPPEFNLGHRSQLLRVVAVVLEAEFKHSREGRDGFVRAEEHMAQVFETLSVQKILDSSVAELAARFGCSRRHLNRLFHQHFGVSVAALRMEMRLSKAVSLLRNPDAKIIRVAEECGFNHLGLFNSCFKRRFHMTPGQWRKNDAPAKMRPLVLGGGPECTMRASGLCPWSGYENSHAGVTQKFRQGSQLPSASVSTKSLEFGGGNGQPPFKEPTTTRPVRCDSITL